MNLDENKNLFKFDAKGDGPPRYTVVNLQWMNESNEFRWVPVGSFGKYLLFSFMNCTRRKIAHKVTTPEN